MAPRPSNMRRMTLASELRRISDQVFRAGGNPVPRKAGSTPGPRRPQQPARCSACARDHPSPAATCCAGCSGSPARANRSRSGCAERSARSRRHWWQRCGGRRRAEYAVLIARPQAAYAAGCWCGESAVPPAPCAHHGSRARRAGTPGCRPARRGADLGHGIGDRRRQAAVVTVAADGSGVQPGNCAPRWRHRASLKRARSALSMVAEVTITFRSSRFAGAGAGRAGNRCSGCLVRLVSDDRVVVAQPAVVLHRPGGCRRSRTCPCRHRRGRQAHR